MNTNIAEPETKAEERTETLTVLDRCDACGAQAYVSVPLSTGSLLFCNHHWQKNEEKLASLATAPIINEAWRLTAVAKLDVSA